MEKTDISPVWLSKMSGLTTVFRNNSFFNSEQTKYFREKAWELYGRMSEDDKRTPVGVRIMAAVTPPNVSVVGDVMADDELSDVNGNIKRLSDYSGKYLLLDFWNRGCGACIMAFPKMKEISESYHDKLTIISISTDFEAGWKNAIAKYDMPWVNLRDPKGWAGLFASYGVMAIPNYVLISPEGKIIDKWVGSEELNKKIGENIEL